MHLISPQLEDHFLSDLVPESFVLQERELVKKLGGYPYAFGGAHGYGYPGYAGYGAGHNAGAYGAQPGYGHGAYGARAGYGYPYRF